MTKHLGDLGSALVDNQLSVANREKALAHVARCSQCAQEVSAIRAARTLLSKAPGIPVPRAEFQGSLIALNKEVVDGEFLFGATTPKMANNPFLDSEIVPKSFLNGDIHSISGLKKHWPKYVAGIAVGALCAGSYALGARPSITPQLTAAATQEHLNRTEVAFDFTPAIGMNHNSHAAPVTGVDQDRLSNWLSAHQFTVPQGLPESVKVVRAGFSSSDPGTLEIIFDTEVGAVILTETYGQLNLSTVTGLPSIEHRSGPIYIASDAPTHLVWQSQENVVELSSSAAIADIGEMIEGFAVTRSDTGITDRLVRGLTQMTGVIP